MNVTLTYAVFRGLMRVSALAALVSSIPVDKGEQELLGLEVVSDTTTTPVTDNIPYVMIIRTIVLRQTNAGKIALPTKDNLIAATTNLYGSVLAAAIPGFVVASVPVVS